MKSKGRGGESWVGERKRVRSVEALLSPRCERATPASPPSSARHTAPQTQKKIKSRRGRSSSLPIWTAEVEEGASQPCCRRASRSSPRARLFRPRVLSSSSSSPSLSRSFVPAIHPLRRSGRKQQPRLRSVDLWLYFRCERSRKAQRVDCCCLSLPPSSFSPLPRT